MRAAGGLSGPDISAFQNSYGAGPTPEQPEDDLTFRDVSEELRAPAALPSYRAAMLPRDPAPTAPPASRQAQDRFEQIRKQLLAEDLDQGEPSSPPAPERQAPYQSARPVQNAEVPPQRTEISSLREAS